MTVRLSLLAGSCWGGGSTTLRTATLTMSTQPQSTALLSGAAVSTPASLTLPSTTPCELWLDACVITSGQSSYPHRHPTSWASSQRSHIISSTPCHRAWLTQCSPVHPMGMHGVSNRDTHLCPPQNNSSIHVITTSEVRRSWHFTNGMRSGWTTLHDSVILSSPTSAPTHREWPFRQQRGFDLTTSALVSDVSALACTNRVWPLLRHVSVAQKNKPSTYCPRIFNTSSFPWTARPDGSWCPDNWMAAQHLPRDRVRSSSGLKKMAQTTTTIRVKSGNDKKFI